MLLGNYGGHRSCRPFMVIRDQGFGAMDPQCFRHDDNDRHALYDNGDAADGVDLKTG